jgi:hypothetical protein
VDKKGSKWGIFKHKNCPGFILLTIILAKGSFTLWKKRSKLVRLKEQIKNIAFIKKYRAISPLNKHKRIFLSHK